MISMNNINFSKKLHFHFIGIHGVGQVNLSIILAQMGHVVTGHDQIEALNSPTANLPQKLSINVTYDSDFDEKFLPSDTDVVVYTIHGGLNNPQIKKSISKEMIVLSQSKLLSSLIKQFTTSIAVAGTNGKTTTTALISQMFHEMGENPSFYIGTAKIGHKFAGHFGSLKSLIFECDEYAQDPPKNKGSKLKLFSPTHALCTNIEFDHPDIFENINAIKEEFYDFFIKVLSGPTSRLIYCIDNENLSDVVQKILISNPHFESKIYSYGFSSLADLKIQKLPSKDLNSNFKLIPSDKINNRESFDQIDSWKAPLQGDKNISNCTGGILLMSLLGFAPNKLKNKLPNIQNPSRRMQVMFENSSGGLLIDDYAHHPDAISNLISTMRSSFPLSRIIIIFEPHTFSRTASLLEDFLQTLSSADLAYLMPTYPSREKIDDYPLLEDEINKKVKKFPNILHANNQKILNSIEKNYLKSDIIITAGAGDIYKLHTSLKKIIENE